MITFYGGDDVEETMADFKNLLRAAVITPNPDLAETSIVGKLTPKNLAAVTPLAKEYANALEEVCLLKQNNLLVVDVVSGSALFDQDYLKHEHFVVIGTKFRA